MLADEIDEVETRLRRLEDEQGRKDTCSLDDVETRPRRLEDEQGRQDRCQFSAPVAVLYECMVFAMFKSRHHFTVLYEHVLFRE